MTSPKPRRSLTDWFWDVWCGTATTAYVAVVVTDVATGQPFPWAYAVWAVGAAGCWLLIRHVFAWRPTYNTVQCVDVEHRNGIPWDQTRIPRPRHRHAPQSRGEHFGRTDNTRHVHRCRCGAYRTGTNPKTTRSATWNNPNSRQETPDG